MPSRFSLNIDLTLGVNAPLDNQFLEDARTKWDPKKKHSTSTLLVGV
jgi:hypothetical protein